MIAAVIVMKFGGTSLGDARSIRQTVEIVRGHLADRPVVVVSAHAGVTDALQAIAATAPHGESDTKPVIERHRTILADLGLDVGLLDPLLAEIEDLARGLRLVGSASAKAVDRLLSYGERCSARTVAAALRQASVTAEAVDAFAAGLRTDSAYGRARPEPDVGGIQKALAGIEGVPVVTGFVGADIDGNVTTLGRNGSDYSAALFGAALGVAEIQVWKDVDGIRTADPKLVPAARPIREMNYEVVCELASFGSKVLHPAAMVPAMACGIPILVRNTRAPEQPGTRIANQSGLDKTAVSAIAHRTAMALVTVMSDRLEEQHTFLARLFTDLKEQGCNVGPVAISEAAVTFAAEEAICESMPERLGSLGTVRIERGRAVVGVVGDASAIEQDRAAVVLLTLANAGIRVQCAGQGARGGTVAVVIAEDRLREAVTVLHDRFFTEAQA